MNAKKITLAILVTLLLVGSVSAQETYTQNRRKSLLSWPQEEWFHFQNNNEAKTLANTWFSDLVAGDTVWTDTYYNWPYMDFEITVEDTGATDSIKTLVELWSTDDPDTTNLQFIKNLSWTPDDAGSAVDTMIAVDRYWCYVGATRIPQFTYYRLRIICFDDHAILPGARLRINAQANTIR
jgi:hypothetical protein